MNWKLFAVTATCLLLGMVIRRIPVIPVKTGHVLNRLVIYVSLPAMVLLKIPELTFSTQLLVPALLPWAMLLLSAGAVLLLARGLLWDRATTGCLMLMVPLGNTSFLGVPMVQAFFGAQAIPYALLYDQLGSFLALAIYGSVVVAVYGMDGARPTWWSVARRTITFPPFLALLLALGLRTLHYPGVVSSLLGALSSTLAPLAIMAVGFQLSIRLSRGFASQLGIGLSLKMVAAPLAALGLCQLCGVLGEPVRVAIFEAGMPPMITAGVVAISANLAPTLTSALAGIGIVASFVTLPVLYRLLS